MWRLRERPLLQRGKHVIATHTREVLRVIRRPQDALEHSRLGSDTYKRLALGVFGLSILLVATTARYSGAFAGGPMSPSFVLGCAAARAAGGRGSAEGGRWLLGIRGRGCRPGSPAPGLCRPNIRKAKGADTSAPHTIVAAL